jgi:alkylation response protein AidB-like acyl-CoA dehydrogenase
MSTYSAPVRDMRFVMHELAGLDEIISLPGFEETSPDVVEAILDEAGKFASEVLDPINAQGDRQGCRWQDGVVTSADGFKDAYRLFCETGWNGLASPAEFGGQGLPALVSTAVHEMWNASNMAFSLCPTLTYGAVEAIAHHGSDALRATYLPKMIAGTWTGTMNLTEPQAGSDVGAIRTRAVAHSDGTYRITGTKIFITWGEHDVAENIIHLVLARLPDAPPGVRGISLFVVPKFLVNDDGSLGGRNDLVCASIEHKMGIHGSPTAVMAFGEKEGAVGYIIGEPNRGLEYMFTMMNHARLNVGLEGVAISERAYQRALAYARERVQGAAIGDTSGEARPILCHPDVRRMLLDMKSRIEAMRALAYWVAAQMDRGRRHPEPAARRQALALVDFLTPVVKGWCTESAVELTSTGVQVHGGVGFIEETGVSQYYRDARIIPIYEGTTAIQANDLVGRKLAREKVPGSTARAWIEEVSTLATALAADADLGEIGTALRNAVGAFQEATTWLLANFDGRPQETAAGAVPYLKLTGIVAGGWMMAQAAKVAQKQLKAGSTDDFYRAKLATARYFAAHVLPQVGGLRDAIVGGSAAVFELPDALF